ncbi:MAG: lauroyl acyltransferase [Alphaproteobacteria bacterium]|nr:lauroyl acyltransferase [Alphaproteobacteria bacterium]
MTLRWRHRLEWFLAKLVWALFGALPLDWASALGGGIGRTLGPLTRAHRRAIANLRRALPEVDAEATAMRMWDNLGRTVAEFPHLAAMRLGRELTVEGAERIEALKTDGRPGILLAGHLGNLEAAALSVSRLGLPLTVIYRAANNPLVDAMIRDMRAHYSEAHVNKGAEGARAILATLKAGGHLGMMSDQKLNEGVAVPFFGRDAMSAPAWAKFALRYRCPVVIALVERLEGARFRVVFRPPLDLPDSGDAEADTVTLIRAYHRELEDWIRPRPWQWFWVHRRWPD